MIGRKTFLLVGSLIFFISMLLYNYTTYVTLLLLLRVLHGLEWGAATTAATTLIADIAPPSRRGEAMGIILQFAGISPVLIVLAALVLFIKGYKHKGET